MTGTDRTRYIWIGFRASRIIYINNNLNITKILIITKHFLINNLKYYKIKQNLLKNINQVLGSPSSILFNCKIA